MVFQEDNTTHIIVQKSDESGHGLYKLRIELEVAGLTLRCRFRIRESQMVQGLNVTTRSCILKGMDL